VNKKLWFLALVLLILSILLSACASATQWEYAGKEGSELGVSFGAIVQERKWDGETSEYAFSLLVQRTDNGTTGVVFVDSDTYNSIEVGEKIYIKP